MKTFVKRASAAVVSVAVLAAVVFDLRGKASDKDFSAVGGCEGEHERDDMIPWNGGEFSTESKYYIDEELSLSKTIDISSEVTLCLNGKTLKTEDTSSVFNIKEGGVLTICDCKGEGTITGSTGSGVTVSGGTLKLEGGIIAENKADNGAGVKVDKNGKFEMSGGAICKNTADHEAGGVYVSQGSEFTMNGGKIYENTVLFKDDNDNGGGVYTAGKFIMNDNAVISDNTSGSKNNDGKMEYHFGGGVCVSGNNAEFIMDGGTLSGNNALYGGGVYVSSGMFKMNGGTIGGGNNASIGGGIAMGGGEVEMNGGDVINNESSYGGGVYMRGGEFVMDGGKVSENNSKNGGGVYLSGRKSKDNDGKENVFSGTFTMNGGEISDNTAEKFGLGVYVDNEFGNETMTLAGNVVIKSPDKVDATKSNVYLKSGKTITIEDGFIADPKIGIHPEELSECSDVDVAVFGENAEVKDISEFFTNDIIGQDIVYSNEDEKVLLNVPHEFKKEWSNDEEHHWYDCIRGDEESGTEDHDWVKITTHANCLNDGSETEQCSMCGFEKEPITLKATGHDWGNWVVTKEPAVNVKGEETRTCKNDPAHVEKRDVDALPPVESSDDENSEPESSKPENSEVDSSEPESGEVDSSEPESGEADSSEPESSEPENSEVDSSEPESSEADSSESENSEADNNNDNSNTHDNELVGDDSNPATGIAISVGPAAVFFALTAAIKRRRK